MVDASAARIEKTLSSGGLASTTLATVMEPVRPSPSVASWAMDKAVLLKL